jgi:hypothetical protein
MRIQSCHFLMNSKTEQMLKGIAKAFQGIDSLFATRRALRFTDLNVAIETFSARRKEKPDIHQTACVG